MARGLSCDLGVQLRDGLVPLLKDIRERGTPVDASVLAGRFDTTAQVGA